MSANWDRCYRRHFGSYFGKPFDVQTYRPGADSPPLQLATFDQPYPGYRVYASVGLTAYEADVKALGEVILLADTAWKDVPFLFINALFFAVQHNIPLTSRFAIGVAGLMPAFAEQFDKAALYFTLADGFPEGFEKVECDGEAGLVLQALFISEAEHELLKRQGPTVLEERLHGQEADLCSLLRPSSV